MVQRISVLIRPLKRGSIHMKFYMTGQEKGDLLIQVTAWAGLTVHQCLGSILNVFHNKTYGQYL